MNRTIKQLIFYVIKALHKEGITANRKTADIEIKPFNSKTNKNIQGFYNIAVTEDLKELLTNFNDFIIIKIKNDKLYFKGITHLFYKGKDINNIYRDYKVSTGHFNYYMQFIYPDTYSNVFIIHKKNVMGFINRCIKAYQKNNFNSYDNLLDHYYNNVDDENIKSSLDYKNIFKLDEYDRQLFFTMRKQALNKKDLQLLKDIRKKAGGKPFYIYLEELEEQLKEAKEAGNEPEEIKLQKKINQLTEEDNTWNLFKTTLEDYI